MKGLIPQSIAEAETLAKKLSRSAGCPDKLRNKEDDVLAVILAGIELGMPPMTALRSIYLLNGRTVLWGDAMLGLVMAHHTYQDHKEWFTGEKAKLTAHCEVWRKGKPTSVVVSFSAADAQEAGLIGKDLYGKYLGRMLKARAKTYALRDTWPDVLGGLSSDEEAIHFDKKAPEVTHEVVEAEKEVSDVTASLIQEIWNAKDKDVLAEISTRRTAVPEQELELFRTEWMKRKEELDKVVTVTARPWTMAQEFEEPKSDLKMPWADEGLANG